ncbi:MAG TPA: LicD family protein [Chlamydiales bacterium]|nr:LicD family protein [Chlamydiales bacterium]
MSPYSQLASWIIYFGMPVVAFYHQIHENIFLGVAAEDAEGLEKIGNILLTPVQYILDGKKAVVQEDGISYKLQPNFEYHDHLTLKLTSSVLFLQPSLLLGSIVKGAGYLSEGTNSRLERLKKALKAQEMHSHHEEYTTMGIDLSHFDHPESIDLPLHKRRPGEENHFQEEKECFKEIVSLLNKNQIVYWADCGTCLGAYRYGGIIPWDHDIDLSVLSPDFSNVMNVLKDLDPEKYHVQDWSGRDKPNTYIRIYVKNTRSHIDIYHFAIDEKAKTISSIVSNEESAFLPRSWKIREGRFKVATPFDLVFPLKKAQFDGMEVFVPNMTKQYLQMRYGENIDPVKIYNEKTNTYEKDLSHPYWQLPYAY